MGAKPGVPQEPREERLVSEFIADAFHAYPSQTRVRLGPLRTFLPHEVISKTELSALGNMRRWADALVFLKGSTVLIEGAIYPDPGDVSKLLYYKELFGRTPEFAERWRMPVEMLLVNAIPDPILTALARAHGVKVITFRPAWVLEYLQTIELRKQQATPPRRQ